MSIDDMVGRDSRIKRLALLCSWSHRETVGCLVMDVWPIAYDRLSATVDPRDVDAAAGREGFSAAMVEVGLATTVKSGIRLAGAAERIEYLLERRKTGQRGGLARVAKLKLSSSSAQARREAELNHPTVPDPSPSVSPSPSAVPDLQIPPKPPQGGVSPPVRRKPSDKLAMTSAEEASVNGILKRLSERSGVAYRGAVEHKRLILNQLRRGLTEEDLRKVLWFKANEWSSTEMAQYLRPETLFGPKTIERYLDAARSAHEKHLAESGVRKPDDQPNGSHPALVSVIARLGGKS